MTRMKHIHSAILAAALLAIPVAAQADDMVDALTHFGLVFKAAKGGTDCLRPASQLSMLEQRTCSTMIDDSARRARQLTREIRHGARESAPQNASGGR